MTNTTQKNWPKWNLTTTIYNLCLGMLHDYALEGETGETIVGIGDQNHRISVLCRQYIDEGHKPAENKYGKAIWALARSAGTAGSAVVRFQERGPRHEVRDKDTVGDWRDDLGNIRLLAATHPDEWDKMEPAGLYPNLEDPAEDPNAHTLIEHSVHTLQRLSARVDAVEKRLDDLDTWKPQAWNNLSMRVKVKPEEEEYADVAMPMVDHSKPKPKPQGWSDINWNRIDKMERASNRFLKEANKKPKRRNPFEVEQGIAGVRMCMNDWLQVNQPVYPDHPLTKTCVKIVAETTYADFMATPQNKKDVHWVRFRNNVNALNLECSRFMREPEVPKTGVEPTTLDELTKEPSPKPQGWTDLQFARIKNLAGETKDLLNLSSDRWHDALSAVRKYVKQWLNEYNALFPDHPLTKACLDVDECYHLRFDYEPLRQWSDVEWTMFNERVRDLHRECNLALQEPEPPKTEEPKP